MKQKYCKECKKKIDLRSTRCLQCAPKYAKYPCRKGKNHPNYKDGRRSKIYYCIEENCNKKITYKNWLYGGKKCSSCAKLGNTNCKGHKLSISTRKKIGLATKRNWQNPKIREKIIKNTIKSNSIKSNKPEKLLNKLLENILPREYKINVKANVMTLGGKIPDFVNCNGKKKIIEHYGDYWHSKKRIKKYGNYEDTEKGRIKYFKKFGWDTLIIWEHELKDLEKVKNKILKFNKK